MRVQGSDDSSVESLSLDEIRRYGPELHERFRRIQVGAIPRDQVAWRLRTGELRNPYREWTEPAAVLCRGADGTPAGMTVYHVDDRWQDGDPDFALTVQDMFAVHPAATGALWRHLPGMEWVRRIVTASIGPDDPLPLRLGNPRACVPQPGLEQTTSGCASWT
jgi:predicted acetyltransferase